MPLGLAQDLLDHGPWQRCLGQGLGRLLDLLDQLLLVLDRTADQVGEREVVQGRITQREFALENRSPRRPRSAPPDRSTVR